MIRDGSVRRSITPGLLALVTRSANLASRTVMNCSGLGTLLVQEKGIHLRAMGISDCSRLGAFKLLFGTANRSVPGKDQ